MTGAKSGKCKTSGVGQTVHVQIVILLCGLRQADLRPRTTWEHGRKATVATRRR